MDQSELRSIQMSIMDCIHSFCVNNGICYSISSGTLLGAIRHKGYIPWDDDIDIYMPRSSYDKFINTFGVQSGKYELVDYRNRNPYTQTFAKVIDNTTLVYEEGSITPDLGVWVDVFPIDGVPSNKLIRRLLFSVKRFVSMLIQCGASQGGSSRIKFLFCKYFPLSRICRFKLFEWLITRCPRSFEVCNMSSGGPLNYKKCFSRSCFDHIEIVRFEDREWFAMAGWQEYLTKTYGDYMKLPPIEKRKHHFFEAFYK